MARNHRATVACASIVALLSVARPADAQLARPRDPAIGEAYSTELLGGLWNPTPAIVVSSDAPGMVGTDIDAVSDLGVIQKRHRELRLVLRPAWQHKVRIQYLPMEYQADTVLNRTVVFGGLTYDAGSPVTTTVTWRAWRFGYEYDVIYRDRYRDRGFLGVIAEVKYTDIETQLEGPIGVRTARTRTPIPAIVGIGRVYPLSNVSLTVELTGVKLPNEWYQTKYVDLDAYGTLNFSDSLGIQAGYRSLDLDYRFDDEAGRLTLEGWYVAGVVRF